MTINKVEICGVNTSKLPVLSEQEKADLFARIQQGDMKAREEFINGNLRLVLSIIQRFNNRGENVDDLFQVGCIGLIKALDNFDTSHNVKYSTYAVPMIIGEIRRYLRDNNSIRVSRSMRDIAYRSLAVKEKLTTQNGREPTIAAIAAELNVPKEDIVIALDAIMDPISLHEPVYNNEGDAIFVMDQVCDSKNTDEMWLEEISLKEAMKKLGDREKHILNMRFFQGKTQVEVAEEIGITLSEGKYIFERYRRNWKGTREGWYEVVVEAEVKVGRGGKMRKGSQQEKRRIL